MVRAYRWLQLNGTSRDTLIGAYLLLPQLQTAELAFPAAVVDLLLASACPAAPVEDHLERPCRSWTVDVELLESNECKGIEGTGCLLLFLLLDERRGRGSCGMQW